MWTHLAFIRCWLPLMTLVKLFNSIKNVFTYKMFYRPSTRSLTAGWILRNIKIILNFSNSNKSPDACSVLCKLFSYLNYQLCPEVNWILPSQYIINYLLATILFLIFFFFFFYSLGYLEKETYRVIWVIFSVFSPVSPLIIIFKHIDQIESTETETTFWKLKRYF